MIEKVNLTISVGELFTARAALERWQIELDRYEKNGGMTEVLLQDVKKFKKETQNILKAIADARSRYLQDATAIKWKPGDTRCGDCDNGMDPDWKRCPFCESTTSPA